MGTILRDTLQQAVEHGQHESQEIGLDASWQQKENKPSSEHASTTSEELPVRKMLPTVLSQLDFSHALNTHEYEKELNHWQTELHLLHLEAQEQNIATVVVFEGPDAAGKGGAIRRITSAFEARNYQVHGVAQPTDEEMDQHYLWRFWRHIPRDGHVAIFDRSWYGRVLVERVENLASDEEWRRAYAEINDFENQLIEHGSILIKYWIHITPDEQLRRFKVRESTPHKKWKLTDDDWRNRARWHDYEVAVNDIVQYTSTRAAAWTLIEGNDKRYARIKVLKTLCGRLSEQLS